jgi:hypothetical protein
MKRKALCCKDLRQTRPAPARRKPLRHNDLRRFDTANTIPKEISIFSELNPLTMPIYLVEWGHEG